jgi:hypothetical protein
VTTSGYSDFAAISITAGEKYDEKSIIRLVEETDIPVYHYVCPNTLGGECVSPSCKHCILALRGYVTFTGGKRDFTALPAAPEPFYGYLCSEHNEELCDTCDVYLEGKTRFRVYEWNPKSRIFFCYFVREVIPLQHGQLARGLEKQQLRERRERAVKRNSTRKPYDPENSRARKTLARLDA